MTIYEKLLKIQSELKVPKNQYNKFGNYAYRSAEDILESVKPLAHKHGCVVTVGDEMIMLDNRYYIKATVSLTNVEDGTNISVQAFAREEENKKGMDGSQITGSASSYARKYALNGMFAIDDTKDADATNKHGKEDKPLKKASESLIKELQTLYTIDEIKAVLAHRELKSVDELSEEDIIKAIQKRKTEQK